MEYIKITMRLLHDLNYYMLFGTTPKIHITLGKLEVVKREHPVQYFLGHIFYSLVHKIKICHS